jgi:heme-degrading monooxygenase HmoA
VIARLWSARSTKAQSPAYAEHLRGHVLPALQKLDGYAGAQLLERETSGSVEIIVITFWRSMESIHDFAGPDPEKAVVADEAAALLTEFDRRVLHYDVILEERC